MGRKYGLAIGLCFYPFFCLYRTYLFRMNTLLKDEILRVTIPFCIPSFFRCQNPGQTRKYSKPVYESNFKYCGKGSPQPKFREVNYDNSTQYDGN